MQVTQTDIEHEFEVINKTRTDPKVIGVKIIVNRGWLLCCVKNQLFVKNR